MINKMVGVFFLMCLIVIGGCTTDWFGSSTNTKPRFPVNKFVNQHFVDRWPVVEAYRYGSDIPARSSVVTTLEDILEDSNHKSAWAHSVATLGFFGGDRAGRIIDNFVKKLQKSPSLSLYEQRALHSGLVALGSWAWTSKHRPGLVAQVLPIRGALNVLESYVKYCGKFLLHAISNPGFYDLIMQEQQKQMKVLNRATNANDANKEQRDGLGQQNQMQVLKGAAKSTLDADDENNAIKEPKDKLEGTQGQLHTEISICQAVPDPVLQREFAQAALWGLALSGEKTVGFTLQEFAVAQDGDPAVKNFIPEAQRAYERITQIGLLCYYEPYSFECQQRVGLY